jgi:GDP-4-dehydro-6-deoxy-D-mannose reductase
MRVLITGFTGFVGSHLADYLVARGDVEVFGTYRWRSRMDNVEHLRDQVRLVECDLRDAAAARHVIRDVRPDRVFHLAAQSYVPTSWLTPGETLSGNVLGQVNLFEAVRDLDLPARVHVAGSS